MDSTVLTLLLWLTATILVAFMFLFLCFILYLYYVHKINDHLPGPPRSSFILGNVPELLKYKKTTGRTLKEYLLEKRLEYGPIFLVFFLHRPVVYFSEPSYVREVFINNHKHLLKSATFVYNKWGFPFGERGPGYGLVSSTNEMLWQKRRRLMNPAFHRKCLKNFMSNFNNVCDRFLARMDTVADDGKPTSMAQEFAKVTLEAISQVSFNINTNAIEDPESPFPSAIRNFLQGVQANFDIPLNHIFLSIFQFRIFQNASKIVQINATRFLRKFASDCITTRMRDIAEKKDVPDDLLSLLINEGSLKREEIIDEFITIFIAGQETTANSLAFALYEILCNPHVEAKLLNEITEVLGEREVVAFDDLSKLKYLGQVLDEGHRKHPVIGGPSRVLQKEIVVGGYRIPKGNNVSGDTFLLGMNPEIWKEPEIFDPERFSDAMNIPNLSMTHFPFSIGPRNCIGQTFAKFESKVILAKLLQKFRFKLLPNQTDRMEQRTATIPRDGVICEVRRQSSRQTQDS